VSDGEDRSRAVSINIDRDVCIGSGMCVAYAPGTFSQNEEAKVILVDPAGDPADTIRAAVEACPTGALSLTPHES
jgi:ferredoxin